MKCFITVLLSYLIILGCNESHTPLTGNKDENQDTTVKKYSQVNYKIDLHTPTVGITNYTLISNNLARDSSMAREIIQAKVILPLAMQKHDAALFDSILARDFISQGEGEFLNRKEYIHDRVNGKWLITDVQYENLVIEFFGDWAMLTYRNRVKEKDEFGKENLFIWYWSDIWVKENDRWKIKVLRAIN